MMRKKTEAEAFACLAVMVAAADGVGTVHEGHFLFDRMARLPVFEGLDAVGFTTLLSEASRHVVSFARPDDGALSDEGISILLREVRGSLSPELRQQALLMARDLARADDVSREEEALLERIRQELLLPA